MTRFMGQQEALERERMVEDQHRHEWGQFLAGLESKGLRLPDGNKLFSVMAERGYLDALPPGEAIAAAYNALVAADPSLRSAPRNADPNLRTIIGMGRRQQVVIPIAGNARPPKTIMDLVGSDDDGERD